jgi:UDP-glucose 4-epimerase
MRYLVTGGMGFLGWAVANDLLKKGHEVVIVDNMFDPAFRTVGVHGNHGLAFHAKDCRELANPSDLDGEYEALYHFAGHYANVRSLNEPMENVAINMGGTMAALEFCKRNEIKKMMYASSSGVYGAMEVVAYAESSAPRPSTPYEVTKYAGELLCDGYCSIYGISLVAPRFFNVYGPGDLPGLYRAVIPNFFRCALRKEPLNVTGKMSSRDFTYIDDVVSAIQAGVKRIGEAPGRITLVYNIATGREMFINKLAGLIREVVKSESVIEVSDTRYWDNAPRRVGDVHKFRALFPEEAEQMRSVEKGILDAAEWYKAVCV